MLSILLHVTTIAVVAWFLTGWLKWLWLGLVWFSGCWVLGRLRGRGTNVAVLVVDEAGEAHLQLHGENGFQAAYLHEDSRIQRYGAWLHWQLGRRTLWQFVWVDMTDADAFRRLKVWAIWCRPKIPMNIRNAPPMD
ncbi:hypothetical protein [Snodgrassella sp. CFCC 13594]|uniref:hypothetical protein n=1 Tax=Snodgrassella sp. CFCC 13594 TaxID=1775559 RepID=UPI000829C54E|nr:hypothetical protein [Snodgrassella sp. CFCC 13594]